MACIRHVCLRIHFIEKYITKSVHRASRSYWESCSAVCSTGRSNSSSSSTGTTHLMQRDKSRMWQRMKEKERVAALSIVFIALKWLDFLEMCAFSLHLFVLPLVCHIQKAPFLALWLLHSDHPLIVLPSLSITLFQAHFPILCCNAHTTTPLQFKSQIMDVGIATIDPIWHRTFKTNTYWINCCQNEYAIIQNGLVLDNEHKPISKCYAHV